MVCALGSDVRNIPGWGGAVAGYGGSVEYPKVEEGYMSRTSDPFEIYHCAIERWCPGGAPGACLPGRNPEKVACGECMPGTYAVDSGECLDCSTGDQTALALFLVLLVLVVLVAGVATIAVIVNRDIASQTHSKIAVVVLGGMMFSGLQVLTVYNAISLVWFQPMQAILKVISLISFDFTPLKTGCVWDGGGPVNYIVRQLVAPSLIPVVLVTLLVKRSRFRRDMEILPELNNAVGLLFSTLFIPITLSSLVPMIIDNHPGDSGKSVKSLPAILVMEGPDYLWLLWFGIIGLFIVPLPFLSICGYATWKYPSWMTAPDKTATRGVRAFRFLFSRFTPPSYQYGMVLLIRSFLICLVPVVLAGHKRVASQVIAMCFILCSFTIAQQQMRPWRDHFSNVLDGALNMCLLLLLVCGSMVSGIALEDFEVKVLGMMAFVTFLGLAVGSFVYLVMVYFVLAERFQVFICHHRAAAAAQARLIKLLLTKKGKKVYVDSDNLEELDTLFDTVKHRVEHVVVYLTSGTLSQPWCAGEISTAFDNPAVKKTAVRHPSFVPPSEEALSDLSAYIDLTNCTLSEYGISFARVADAFRALLGETTPSVIVDEAWLGAQRFHAVVEGILDGPSGAGARDTQLPSAEGMVVVSADPGDDEALAAMEILVHKIPDDVASAAEVCCPADHLSGEEPALGGLVASSRAVVVLLSKDSLISTPQLITIVSAMKSGHRPEVIPLCTPSFVHPSCAYYSEVLPKVWPGDAKEAEGILRSFLNNDTLLFSALATEKAMDFQAAQVVGRMQGPKSGPVQGGQGSWEDPVPRVVLAEDSPPTFGNGDDDNSPEAAEPAAAVPSETQTPRVGI